MAYITHNGTITTLRALFRDMAPKRHCPDHSQSQVIDHIKSVLQCDEEGASRAFNSMRNPSSMVLRFDRSTAHWRGCDWIPEDQNDREIEGNKAMRHLERENNKLKKDMRRIFNEMSEIRDYLEKFGSSKSSSTIDAEAAVKGHEMQISGIFTRLTRLEEGLVALREEIYGSLDAMEGRFRSQSTS